MKKTFLLLVSVIMVTTVWGQAPQAFKYQAVARDAGGQVIQNQNISFLVSIIQGSVGGAVVYSEVHTATTNDFGIVSLEIGNGTAIFGSYATIPWNAGPYFLKIEMDENGGNNYNWMGTSQLLSVPYSNHSVTSEQIPVMTSVERDSIVSPRVGMQIYNSTTECINYFSGVNWYESCGDCTPMPTQPYAGSDQYFSDTTTTTILEANTPQSGTGTWSVINGTGGVFVDIHDPVTVFTGQQCNAYTLGWTIANPCGSNTDNVNIEFDATPTIANAGPDQEFFDNTTVAILNANTPIVGDGTWSIISGQGGSLYDIHDPNTTFTGVECETYTLRWTISTECDVSFDDVMIVFFNTPTVANAGPDQWYISGSYTTLEANTPLNGLGTWQIISGQSGAFVEPTNPNSLFFGIVGAVYELKWTISTNCGSSMDNVFITFGNTFVCGITPLKDQRDGVLYSTAQIGAQCWMAENLKATTYKNGAPIPHVTDANAWSNLTTGAYVWYDNDISWKDKYGALYNWYATVNANGLCPTGWHVPTNDEWTDLTDYIGGTSSPHGNELKSCRQVNSPLGGGCNTSEHPRWEDGYGNYGTDDYGFSGLPGGYRDDSGGFSFIGSYGNWWSSTEDSSSSAWYRYLSYYDGYVGVYYYNKRDGFSVRCLRD